MSTNNPKALFQVNNGTGWQTIAEADIIDGVIPPPPNAFTMARAMHKQIIYTGYTPVEVTVASSNPRDTHFAGFAKAVVEEMYKLEFWIEPGLEYDDMRQAFADIIARRAYDLACHVATHTQLTAHGDMSKIPDMPELLREVQE